MGGIVYLRMKKILEVNYNESIRLSDIANISGDSSVINQLENTLIYKITDADNNVSVIDGFVVINELVHLFPELEFQQIGPTQSIIKVKNNKKETSVYLIPIIWLLLFIGSAMAIMNFHYDVSMQQVQQKLYYLLTGEESEYPLWLQIPYSVGLGVGMILFFNHLFKKRFNEEPSPLEIELFKYQQDLDNYVSYYENKLNTNPNESNSSD